MAFEFWEIERPQEGQGPDRMVAIERALARSLALGEVAIHRLMPYCRHSHKINEITGPRELRVIVSAGGLAVGSLIGAVGRYDFVLPYEETWMDLSVVHNDSENFSVTPYALIRDVARTPELTSLRALHERRFRNMA